METKPAVASKIQFSKNVLAPGTPLELHVTPAKIETYFVQLYPQSSESFGHSPKGTFFSHKVVRTQSADVFFKWHQDRD